jgi:hypothetical protein
MSYFVAMNEKGQLWVWKNDQGIARPVEQVYSGEGEGRVRVEERYPGTNKAGLGLWVGKKEEGLRRVVVG